MRTNTKASKWPLLLSVFALTLTVAIGLNFNTNVSASGGNDLGTSPFDFSDAAYRAQGVVPENIVLRVGTAARAGDFVVDNTNTDPNRTNIRTIETTPGTTGSSGLTYANIFGVLNSTSFERDAAGRLVRTLEVEPKRAASEEVHRAGRVEQRGDLREPVAAPLRRNGRELRAGVGYQGHGLTGASARARAGVA